MFRKKIKSMGVWFKEKIKSKNKLTLEAIADMLHQDLNLNRQELGKKQKIIDALQKENEELRDENIAILEEFNDVKEELSNINVKMEGFEIHFWKLAKITESSNKEFAEGLKKIVEGKCLVKELPEDKTKGTQKAKVKSSTKTSKIIKDLKEN